MLKFSSRYIHRIHSIKMYTPLHNIFMHLHFHTSLPYAGKSQDLNIYQILNEMELERLSTGPMKKNQKCYKPFSGRKHLGGSKCSPWIQWLMYTHNLPDKKMIQTLQEQVLFLLHQSSLLQQSKTVQTPHSNTAIKTYIYIYIYNMYNTICTHPSTHTYVRRCIHSA